MRTMSVLLFTVALAATEPSWWANPPQPAGEIVGIGAGPDADSARQRAIANLVESLVVDVSVRRHSATAETTVDGTSRLTDSFEQELNTSSAIRDLPGLTTTAQVEDAGVYYAQVRVAQALLLPELARRCAALNPIHVPPPAPPTWTWVTAAQRELAILRERQRLSAILTSRGVAPPPITPHAARMVSDLGVLAATSQVTVAGAAGPAINAVMVALGKSSLTQSAAAPLKIETSVAQTRSRTDRGWHVVQMTVTMEVRTTTGTVIGQLPCVISGTSTKDAAGADQAALGRLGPALDKLVTDQLLPLLLSHHLE